jgi:hypothetical protein
MISHYKNQLKKNVGENWAILTFFCLKHHRMARKGIFTQKNDLRRSVGKNLFEQ